MALKKLCVRCGSVINYTDRLCSKCDNSKEKAENNRQYDKKVRQVKDKQYTDFYQSKEWKATTREVKRIYKGLDIYSYYVLGKIEYGNISHHIEELRTKEGWGQRLNTKDMIYLTTGNHNLIHKMYEKDYEGTKRMLRELIKRYKDEFGLI